MMARTKSSSSGDSRGAGRGRANFGLAAELLSIVDELDKGKDSDEVGAKAQMDHAAKRLRVISGDLASDVMHSSAVAKLNSGSPEALKPLLSNRPKSYPCFVLSVDLRRSTDLMLKARPAEKFADFISELADRLRLAVTESFGIFDKFTGDGILAFFPDFMSGPSPGLRAINAAYLCHSAFSTLYSESYDSFSSVMLETGLGVGIDYGDCTILAMGSQFTVVGEPVVYACRLSGAPHGKIYANHPAYRYLLSMHSEYLEFSEAELDFKHEGRMRAYDVKRNKKPVNLGVPEWS